MARFSWEKEIKKHFGHNAFTAEELLEKSGTRRDVVWKSLWNMVNRSKVLVRDGNKYWLVQGLKCKEKPEARQTKKYLTKKELLDIISKKFGDEEFTVDDMMRETGSGRLTAYSQLRRLHDSRFIKRVRPGVYVISTKGHNSVAESLSSAQKAKPAEEEKDDSQSLLNSIESTWENKALYKWATRIVTQDEDWKSFGEELIGKAALSDPRCRKILEEKVKEAIRSLMPQ